LRKLRKKNIREEEPNLKIAKRKRRKNIVHAKKLLKNGLKNTRTLLKKHHYT